MVWYTSSKSKWYHHCTLLQDIATRLPSLDRGQGHNNFCASALPVAVVQNSDETDHWEKPIFRTHGLRLAADLIVIGKRGGTAIEERLHGSVDQGVLNNLARNAFLEIGK